MPPELHAYPHAAEAWKQAVNEAKNAYGIIHGVLKGARKESGTVGDQREVRRAIRSAARSVLPNCTETIIFTTVNARALRHFFALRGAIPGDREMRELTVEMLKAVKREAPSLFFDFEVARFENGSPMVRKVAHDAKGAK